MITTSSTEAEFCSRINTEAQQTEAKARRALEAVTRNPVQLLGGTRLQSEVKQKNGGRKNITFAWDSGEWSCGSHRGNGLIALCRSVDPDTTELGAANKLADAIRLPRHTASNQPPNTASHSSAAGDSSSVIAQALAYWEAGLNPIPIKTAKDPAKRKKEPAVSEWTSLQERRLEREELIEMFSQDVGIAIIAGKISGNLEIIDIDEPALWTSYVNAICFTEDGTPTGNEEWFSKLPIVQSPRAGGGKHVYIRCATIAGNKVLAVRIGEDKKKRPLIETRGEGGYIMAPGSPPECHRTGGVYTVIQGDLLEIPMITAEQREILLEAARAFDEVIPQEWQPSGSSGDSQRGDRPGDVFNAKATWSDVLEPARWTFIRTLHDGTQEWRRPDKNSGPRSATTNYGGRDLLRVFTEGAPPLTPDRSYSKFSAYAVLNHGGDCTAAAKALAAMGFGKAGPQDPGQTDTAIDWEEPQPVGESLLPVMPFNFDLLPKSYRDYVQDVAERRSSPPDFVASALLCITANLIGSARGIRPKQFDDWLEVPNLWGANLGLPSSGKSPAQDEITDRLKGLTSASREEFESEEAAHRADLAVFEAEKKALENRMGTISKIKVAPELGKESKYKGDKHLKAANKSDNETELKTVKEKYAALRPPAKPTMHRLMSNDVTMEKAHELCAQNPRGWILTRDELAGLLKRWEKEEYASERAFWLEVWRGRGEYDMGRIGRGELRAKRLCAGIFGGIQPSKILSVISAAVTGEGQDGLIQRFQVLVYPDPVPWLRVDRKPNLKARTSVDEILQRLHAMDCAGMPEIHDEDIAVLRFDNEAQQVFNAWLDDLMQQKIPESDSEALAAHLGKYASLMASIALVLHLVESAEKGEALAVVTRVCRSCAEKAVRWCAYLESHARRVYGMVTSPQLGAHKLSEKIANGALPDGFTIRDIVEKDWQCLDTSDKAEAACKMLCERKWLVRQATSAGPQGGRPTVRYKINPKAILPNV